ncbi:MAG: hypothetical protein QMD14_00180 [Candidatus Aenigmarchaeota archaeon]|nr:hypothetical protein [Candidatus Aenigmarchaeota archaeon]
MKDEIYDWGYGPRLTAQGLAKLQQILNKSINIGSEIEKEVKVEKVCPECNKRIDFYGRSSKHKNVWLYACHECDTLWRYMLISENPKTFEMKKSSLKLYEWNPTLDDL